MRDEYDAARARPSSADYQFVASEMPSAVTKALLHGCKWIVHYISRISEIVCLCNHDDTAPMKTGTAQINGIEMFYETVGSGEPLLLLHGGGGCHEDWVHAGRDQFLEGYALILPDARGHGRSTNPQKTITHRQCALDALALLDDLGIGRCKAIGLSMGGNILLHMATLQPDRIEAMVLVSATMYFPEQARAIMRQVVVENQSAGEWEAMRKRHRLGDEQIVALWEWQRGMKDSYDDMNFTPPSLRRITASTLIVSGDRDFLYPVEMAVEMYRAIPRSALWVVPNGGHGPVFQDARSQFVQTALAFLRK
ncbi:MAG: alpha/beta hydrolase [Candidatus Sulfotelmatobacter sp.]